LSRLQRDVLDAMVGRAAFYFTGGAALAGFYLHHRRSEDLDFFVTDQDELDVLESELQRISRERGWEIHEIRRFPGFRRFIVGDGKDETLLDLVHDPVAQMVDLSDKPVFEGLRVDDLSDIVTNKLCALLGRGDIKDLVDLYFLQQAGIDVPAYVDAAQRKDGGMEPTTLGYVLQSVRLDTSRLLLVKPLSPGDLERFRDDLMRRLLEMAWPGEVDPSGDR